METLFARPAEVGRLASAVPSGAARDYLWALNDAHAELANRLTVAAQLLEDRGDPFSSSAASHRRLTRQFLDGQRALLRQRANALQEADDVEIDARATADAILDEAYEMAGIQRPAKVDAFAVGPISADDAGDEAVPSELQRLLDDWWRCELASSAELLDRANEMADLIRSLARIEAGEVLAAADVPSPLPPPSPGFLDQELLPTDVDEAMSAGDPHELLEVCDSLLRVLDDGSDGPASHQGGVPSLWAPPALPEPWAPPAAALGAASTPLPTAEMRTTSVATAVGAERAGEDAFRRFWGEGPEAHRGRTRSIVRQALVSMLAFTGVLTVIMALIG